MAGINIMYIPYCPKGDCGKKSKRLGSYPTEEEARGAIQWHLERSSYHSLKTEEAIDLSMTAPLDLEEWSDEQVTASTFQFEQQDEPQQLPQRSWRTQPYQKEPYQNDGKIHAWDWKKGKGKGKAIKDQPQASSSSSSNSGIANLTAIQMRLEQQAARVEAASKAAGRFAKQAALAFEEEAANVRELIDDLRKALQ